MPNQDTPRMIRTRTRKKKQRKWQQGQLALRSWGGVRPGAGRKPNGMKAGVSHAQRASLAARFPVHVTMSLLEGLPALRRKAEHGALKTCFTAACERRGFRIVHYSVQTNHLHLIVEARDRETLVRGLQGLSIRVAKALNKVWGRRGTVFADRYHDHVLRTPREVRSALAYVLNNARRHRRRSTAMTGDGRRVTCPDPYSSGWWFDGWKERFTVKGLEGASRPVAAGRTWLLNVGWRRHGLVRLDEVPAHARSA